MTTPEQPAPYPGQSGVSPYNYGWPAPGYGYGRPPSPGASPQDRVTAILLLVSAVLAIAGSFVALTKSVDTSGGPSSDVTTFYDKPWSFSTQSPSGGTSTLQFTGLPLALGATAAVVFGILLLVGLGARRGPIRALGLTAAGILVGATFTVMMLAVDDSQFDTPTHQTSFQTGFWLVVLSGIAGLGAAIPAIVARFGAPADVNQSPFMQAYPYGMQPPTAAYAQPPQPGYPQYQQPQQPQQQPDTSQPPQPPA